MALGHCGVFASKHGQHRAAYDVGSAEDHSVFATEIDAGALEQEHGTGGCARLEQRLRCAGGEEANVVGMEAVDVLVGADSLGDAALSFKAHAFGEGQLDKQTVDRVVRAELVHGVQNLGFGGGVVEGNVGELDVGLSGSLGLHADIGGRVWTTALLYNGEVRLEGWVLSLQLSNVGVNLFSQSSNERVFFWE